MSRLHTSAAFFLAGATVFCAAAWSSPSLAAWIAHTSDAQMEAFGASGTTVSATPSSATGNASLTDPWSGEKTVDSTRKRALDLEHADPWSGVPSTISGNKRPHLTLDANDPWAAPSGGGVKRTKLVGVDPWDGSPSKLSRTQLTLDTNDPWNNKPSAGHLSHAPMTVDASDPWRSR